MCFSLDEFTYSPQGIIPNSEVEFNSLFGRCSFFYEHILDLILSCLYTPSGAQFNFALKCFTLSTDLPFKSSVSGHYQYLVFSLPALVCGVHMMVCICGKCMFRENDSNVLVAYIAHL